MFIKMRVYIYIFAALLYVFTENSYNILSHNGALQHKKAISMYFLMAQKYAFLDIVIRQILLMF